MSNEPIFPPPPESNRTQTSNSDDEKINQYLSDLQSDDSFRQKWAAEFIGEQRLNDERLVDALKSLASSDVNSTGAGAARSTLDKLGIAWSPQVVGNGSGSVSPPQAVTDPPSFFRRYQQQTLAFIGWYVIASILAPVSFGLITTPATLIALLVFGLSKDKKRIAGGILVAVAFNFLMSLILGSFLGAVCFVPFYYNVNF